ncbi:MAG TPA: hypothetical protein VEQ59_22335 [Polyangiaceae bacterium]|nr:hypothetical protein [Polyangiaceae bacterium]
MGRVFAVWLGVLAVTSSFSGAALAQLRELPGPTARGHFEVALHARSMQASARTERAAWLTVTLPLDRLALPRVSAATVPQPLASSPTPAVAPATAPVVASVEPHASFQQLRALSEFSRRATVVALGAVSTASERRRLDAVSSRARASALLPELRLRALHNSDQALRWIPTTDDPYRITQANGTGLLLEASATFRLDRLLFAREELQVERLRQHAAVERLKLEARVLESLLGLFRARELACFDDGNDPERPARVLKVLELFIELDGLTAGWFSREAPDFGRAVWGFSEAVLGQCSAPAPTSPVVSTNPVASLEDSE